MHIVSFEDTQALLSGDVLFEEIEQRLTGSADQSSIANFMVKPKGIIIQDSYNNFAFPIRPKPMIDTKKCDLPILAQIYREEYTAFATDILGFI